MCRYLHFYACCEDEKKGVKRSPVCFFYLESSFTFCVRPRGEARRREIARLMTDANSHIPQIRLSLRLQAHTIKLLLPHVSLGLLIIQMVPPCGSL